MLEVHYGLKIEKEGDKKLGKRHPHKFDRIVRKKKEKKEKKTEPDDVLSSEPNDLADDHDRTWHRVPPLANRREDLLIVLTIEDLAQRDS